MRPSPRIISTAPTPPTVIPPVVPGQVPNESFRSDFAQDYATDCWNPCGVGIQWPPLDTCVLDAVNYMWLFPFNSGRGQRIGRAAINVLSGGTNLRWGIYTTNDPAYVRPGALLLEFPMVTTPGAGIIEALFAGFVLPPGKCLWLALFPEFGIKISGIALGYVAPILPMLDPLSGLLPTQRLRTVAGVFGPLPDPCPGSLEPESDPCPLVFLAPEIPPP